jgi:hypothetical protein
VAKITTLATVRIHFGIASACGRCRQISAHPSHSIREGKVILMKFIGYYIAWCYPRCKKRKAKEVAGICQTPRVDYYLIVDIGFIFGRRCLSYDGPWSNLIVIWSWPVRYPCGTGTEGCFLSSNCPALPSSQLKRRLNLVVLINQYL